MARNHAQFRAHIAGPDWRGVKTLETRSSAAAERIHRVVRQVFAGVRTQLRPMQTTSDLDLSATPAVQSVEVLPLMETVAALTEITG
jgi:hypothetical protein